jgi:hypothetical protein
MEQVNGGMVLYQSVQSLDEDVLRRVRRSNIKLSAYAQLAVHLRGRGLRSSTDLIMGLPGETLKTHLGTLHKMIDLGTDQAHCFQAMMLKGSDMEAMNTRQEYGFVTKYRLGPKNFGEYGGYRRDRSLYVHVVVRRLFAVPQTPLYLQRILERLVV